MKKGTDIKARGKFRITIETMVFRCKGSRFPNLETGQEEIAPGGQWKDGKEGCWYDQGVVHSRTESVSHWKRLIILIRMELSEILKFLKGKI